MFEEKIQLRPSDEMIFDIEKSVKHVIPDGAVARSIQDEDMASVGMTAFSPGSQFPA
jgi:hypothetical protein